ncbi:MAG TPA: sulfatase atsG [Planctomycetaceae bacterium]|nr:sulfatase atsG [Planctomycetaceae bacterium]
MKSTFVFVGILVTLLSARAASASGPDQPNILFVIADDCTFRDLGCYGGQAHTPNIDGLAGQGMLFERCFQAAPMCSPTRHNIYTGLYPVRSGAYPNHTFAKRGTQSVVQYLRPLGYRVALSGKTHISPREVFPFEYLNKGKNPDMKAIDVFMEECKQANTPFCLFACSNEPHTPWDKGDPTRYPPSEVKLPSYIADTQTVREEFSRYLAEITYYDDQVGQLLELLEKHDVADDTLVIVVSEQGNSLPFAKWTCYGNGLQSAMLVRWPGTVQPGSRSNALVEYVDLLPTFVEAAGGTPHTRLEGKSLLGLLKDNSQHHKDHVFGLMTTRGINDGSDVFAIRTVRGERYRLIWNIHHQQTFENACTTSKAFRSMVAAAKAGDQSAEAIVQRYMHRPEYELYDCVADPLELKNLYGQADLEDTANELKRELLTWMEDQGDQGHETERRALLRQTRHQGKTLEDAENAWGKRNRKGRK